MFILIFYSLGILYNFTTDYSKFSNLFPGIRSKLISISTSYNFPFFREIFLNWGMSASSARNISFLLNASNDPEAPANKKDGHTSNAVAVVVGGGQETFYSRPKDYTLVLKNRKGFVKLALQSGRPIVPVLSFNEVDLYDQLTFAPGTWIRSIQDWVRQRSVVPPLVFYGRGFFQNNFGFFPHPRPITTVGKIV